MKAAQFFRLGRMIIKQVSAKRSMAENFPARARRARVRKACVPRALGLLLVDGVPWGASAVFFNKWPVLENEKSKTRSEGAISTFSPRATNG